jgi:hypothetical protein
MRQDCFGEQSIQRGLKCIDVLPVRRVRRLRRVGRVSRVIRICSFRRRLPLGMNRLMCLARKRQSQCLGRKARRGIKLRRLHLEWRLCGRRCTPRFDQQVGILQSAESSLEVLVDRSWDNVNAICDERVASAVLYTPNQ